MSSAASADLRGLAQDLQLAGQTLEQSADQLLANFGSQVMALGQSFAPVKNGVLKGSIGIHRKGPMTIEIGPSVYYGVFQEFGTGSKGEFGGHVYEIKAKKGKTLAWESNGQRHFARKVMHPGVPPTSFMRRAFAEALKDFLPALSAAGQASIVKGPHA